jgi:hypothetical protein
MKLLAQTILAANRMTPSQTTNPLRSQISAAAGFASEALVHEHF